MFCKVHNYGNETLKLKTSIGYVLNLVFPKVQFDPCVSHFRLCFILHFVFYSWHTLSVDGLHDP